jgi:hypothetical protein
LVPSIKLSRSPTFQEHAMTKDSGKSRPVPTPDKKTNPQHPDEVKDLDVIELEERIAPRRI